MRKKRGGIGSERYNDTEYCRALQEVVDEIGQVKPPSRAAAGAGSYLQPSLSVRVPPFDSRPTEGSQHLLMGVCKLIPALKKATYLIALQRPSLLNLFFSGVYHI